MYNNVEVIPFSQRHTSCYRIWGSHSIVSSQSDLNAKQETWSFRNETQITMVNKCYCCLLRNSQVVHRKAYRGKELGNFTSNSGFRSILGQVHLLANEAKMPIGHQFWRAAIKRALFKCWCEWTIWNESKFYGCIFRREDECWSCSHLLCWIESNLLLKDQGTASCRTSMSCWTVIVTMIYVFASYS